MINENMRLLFKNRLAPITISMGFIEGDFTNVVRTYLKWHSSIKKKSNYIKKILNHSVEGTLEQVLLNLLPLKLVQSTRKLFVPTKSNWTTVVDNRISGTDPSAISYLPELLQTRSIWLVASPIHPIFPTVPHVNQQAAYIMEVYGHEPQEWLNLIRKIRLIYDMGKWEFEESGKPFPFEDTERYKNERIQDRLDVALLDKYFKQFGISPFDESFYLPADNPNAVLIETITKDPWRNKDVSLEEARRLNGFDDIQWIEDLN